MRATAAVIAIVLATVAAATAAASYGRTRSTGFADRPAASDARVAVVQQPSFSGTWQLDAAASTIEGEQGLAGLGGAAPEWLHVTHARNGALILSSRVNGAQPRYYIIGGTNELPAPGGEAERMTVATRWEGESLLSTGVSEHEGLPLQVRELMSLADEGASLRLEVTTTHGDVTVTNVLVYERATSLAVANVPGTTG